MNPLEKRIGRVVLHEVPIDVCDSLDASRDSGADQGFDAVRHAVSTIDPGLDAVNPRCAAYSCWTASASAATAALS
jgi:hypothetical protein